MFISPLSKEDRQVEAHLAESSQIMVIYLYSYLKHGIE